jgi:Glycosyl hydrolases family 18
MRYVFLILFILAASCAAHAKAPQLAGQENAIWAGSIFLRGFDPTTQETLTDEKLTTLAERLKHNGIRYIYVFAGPYQKDGHLPSYAFSTRARASIAFLKKTYPSLKILSWIGGVEDKTVHLENETWRETSIQETAKLMASVPFDGVHIDLEYVLFPKRSASTTPTELYDSGWVRFHKKLREKLPNVFLSTVVVSSAPGTRPWKHKHQMKDLIKISRVVDQVAFMYYETHLDDIDSYRENMRLQLEQIQQMKTALGIKTPEYLFGIGTFKSDKTLKSYRDMRFENVITTLTTLDGLINKLSPSARLVDGLAIYGDWTTKPEDWAQIRELWTDGK